MKRFSNGFSALVSYTFGKAIDLVSNNDGPIFTNIFDPGYDRGPADYDVKHTLVASFIYELPFARKHGLGGWQVNGIGYYRSGLAADHQPDRGPCSRPGLTNNRPNVVDGKTGGEPPTRRSTSGSTPTAFTRTETTGTFGNIGRNTLRGPEIFNIDLSLVKNTKIGTLDTELRIETFNIFNHPQFGPPDPHVRQRRLRARSPPRRPRAARPAARRSGRSSSGSRCGSSSHFAAPDRRRVGSREALFSNVLAGPRAAGTSGEETSSGASNAPRENRVDRLPASRPGRAPHAHRLALPVRGPLQALGARLEPRGRAAGRLVGGRLSTRRGERPLAGLFHGLATSRLLPVDRPADAGRARARRPVPDARPVHPRRRLGSARPALPLLPFLDPHLRRPPAGRGGRLPSRQQEPRGSGGGARAPRLRHRPDRRARPAARASRRPLALEAS